MHLSQRGQLQAPNLSRAPIYMFFVIAVLLFNQTVAANAIHYSLEAHAINRIIGGPSIVVQFGMSGAPDVNTTLGRASTGADLAFLAKECLDRTPGGGKGKNYCSFSGDTEVLMADDSTKPISEIDVGDKVLAQDPETGERGGRTVTALWEHQDTLVDLKIGGDRVTTTEDHPFWNASDREWQEAHEIEPGEKVLTADGENRPVEGMDWSTRTGGIAYNLTVADLHTYFVVAGDDEVLVHNTCGSSNYEKGKAAEKRAGIPDGPKTGYTDSSGNRKYPDYINEQSKSVVSVVEVKDLKGTVYYTNQLREYQRYAESNDGWKFILCTDSPLSAPLQQQVNSGAVIRRTIDGCKAGAR